MNQTTVLFNNAELALASYATLQLGSTNTSANITALTDQGLSTKQATEFAGRYQTVVSQFNDTARHSAVGLRNIAGHELRPFSGLREGMSVLAQ